MIWFDELFLFLKPFDFRVIDKPRSDFYPPVLTKPQRIPLIFRYKPNYGSKRKGKSKVELNSFACYMCVNSRLDPDLESDSDLSYVEIGNTHRRDRRFLISSGNNRAVCIYFEEYSEEHGIWLNLGKYYPKYCPNCGRKLSEFHVDDKGVGYSDNCMWEEHDDDIT